VSQEHEAGGSVAEREPEPAPWRPHELPSGNDPSLLNAARGLGWNWGGFLVPYLWLLGHGRVSLGMSLLLSTAIPFLGMLHVVLLPIASILLGLNGNEMAWRHAPYRSVADLVEREREWTRWGWVCAALFLAGLVLMLLYVLYFMEEAMRVAGDFYGS